MDKSPVESIFLGTCSIYPFLSKMISRLPILLLSAQLAFGQQSGFNTWPAYGGDPGGSRYSSLKQINKGNIHALKEAWTFRTGELETYEGTNAVEKAAFEATPILAGNTLFFSTPSSRVFAVDAATGKQKWLYDPKVDLKKHYSEITSRGVSVWPTERNSKNKNVKRRIFIGTIDGRLIALDAQTGRTVESFGNNGTINLREGIGDDISMTSPPAVIGDIIVAGSSMGDNYKSDFPRGVVRAFNAVTGKEMWHWDPLASDTARKTGAANAWSVISVDEKRDLVFVPTGCASPDYYGGNRPGDNLYANSVVAIHATTGKVAWHFQVVHHDIWDYDIAAQPMLIDIPREGKKIPAVAVGTKMGYIFILDRITGKPLFPVEERSMPASDIVGETTSSTQPVPLLPRPLGLQKVSVSDAWGFTPELKKRGEERITRYVNKGIYTPPSLQGTLVTPGNVGGVHWGGMCYDHDKNILYTNINWLAAIIRLVPREKLEEDNKLDNERSMRAETGMQFGTPYVMKRDYLFEISGNDWMIQTAPPWGTLNAINMSNGHDKWQVPLGFMVDTVKYADARKWGSLNFGGAIVTAGDLVFVAATRDGFLRAFDSGSGEMLWESMLPAGGQATPMTYQVNGKQYVVIAAGGHGKFLTKMGDYVVAYALE
ncbi:MAG: pyrroloquinoline quinone-dependent dehydrogenase [Chitinophagaceae bacterium]|nr:pyrroloquinoline quinone-dependent dehydrogenase [Chitinophagaceae bacterium]